MHLSREIAEVVGGVLVSSQEKRKLEELVGMERKQLARKERKESGGGREKAKNLGEVSKNYSRSNKRN